MGTCGPGRAGPGRLSLSRGPGAATPGLSGRPRVRTDPGFPPGGPDPGGARARTLGVISPPSSSVCVQTLSRLRPQVVPAQTHLSCHPPKPRHPVNSVFTFESESPDGDSRWPRDTFDASVIRHPTASASLCPWCERAPRVGLHGEGVAFPGSRRLLLLYCQDDSDGCVPSVFVTPRGGGSAEPSGPALDLWWRSPRGCEVSTGLPVTCCL